VAVTLAEQLSLAALPGQTLALFNGKALKKQAGAGSNY